MRIKYLVFIVSIVSILSIVLFTISCKSKSKNLYEFDPVSLTENAINLSEIADNVTYIPLDKTFPLGLIYKYEFVNNSIYLSAKDIGILVYNRDGKFLRRIGKIGRGPGEYIYPVFFTVDDKTETTYVLDNGGIIKIYSKTGRFLRNLSLKDYGESTDNINSFNSKLLVHYMLQFPETKYEWIVLDSLGNLHGSKNLSIKSITTKWGESGGTYKYENRMYYWNPFNDTVFSILPDLSYKASFLFKPGDHRFPKSDFKSFEQLTRYMHLKQIFETQKFLIIKYDFNKKIHIVLINKSNKKSFLMNLEPESNIPGSDLVGGIRNDFDGGLMFLPNNYFVENNREFCSGFVNPYKIKSHVSNIDFKNSIPKYLNKKKEFSILADSLTETDNKLIMVVRLKK